MKTLFILLSAIIIFSSCKKGTTTSNETPECIQAKINADRGTFSSVDQYTFKNKTVFTFSTNVTDGQTSVYDESCNLICQIVGLTGNLECSGESFSNAIFIRNVWKR